MPIRRGTHNFGCGRRVGVEPAAAYRVVALFGWDDLIFAHLSARIPGPEYHLLINHYNLLFEDITASSLVKIGLDGRAEIKTPSVSFPSLCPFLLLGCPQ